MPENIEMVLAIPGFSWGGTNIKTIHASCAMTTMAKLSQPLYHLAENILGLCYIWENLIFARGPLQFLNPFGYFVGQLIARKGWSVRY